MKCPKCGAEMISDNDVVYDTSRIDWFTCPNCKSTGEIVYNRILEPEQISWHWKKESVE